MAIEDGTIKVGFDGSEVEAGVAKTKKSLDSLGKTAVKSGKEAAKGVDAVGVASAKVSKAAEREDRIRAKQIQRLIAYHRAGTKSTAAYYTELNKVGSNFNTTTLVAQLRAAEKQTKKTTAANRLLARSQNDVSKSVNRSVDDFVSSNARMEQSNVYLGRSAKQTAFALRNVPAQVSDIFVSLQGGQKPLTVLLQQGAQLKDLFGGVGAAARALAGYVFGLVNPFTVAAAAAVALGVAYNSGAEESQRLQSALINTGNVLGKSSGQLTDMATTVGRVTKEFSIARKSVEAFAANGVIAGDLIQTAMFGVVSSVRLTGDSVEEAVGKFEEIAKDPLKALLKFNEAENFLTLDIYKQIKALEDQGRVQEAAALGVKFYADEVVSRAGDVVKNLGYIESAWERIKRGASNTIDDLKGIGREISLTTKLVAETKKLRNFSKVNPFTGSAYGTKQSIRNQAAVVIKLEAELRKEVDKTRADAAVSSASKLAIVRQQAFEKYVGSSSRLSKKGVVARQIEEENQAFEVATKGFIKTSSEYKSALQAHNQALSNIAEKGADKSVAAGIKKTASAYASLKEKTLDYIRVQREGLAQEKPITAAQKIQGELLDFLADKKGKLTATNRAYLTQLGEEVVANDKLIIAQKDRAKVDAAVAKSIGDAEAANREIVASIYDKIEATKKEVANFGKLPSQIEKTTIARLKESKAVLLSNNLGAESVKQLEAQISLRKQLVKVFGELEAKEAAKKASDVQIREAKRAAKEIQREYERMSDSINDSITDALLRGFEDGKDFAKNFRDTLINMFKTLVLRPTVQAIISPVSGAITSLLGGGSAAASAGSSALTGGDGAGGSKSIFNLLGSIKNTFASGNDAIIKSIEGIGAWIADSNIELFKNIGGAIGQYSGVIADVLPYAGAIIQLLKGDVKGAAFTAAGTYIGSLFGPLGAAFGAAVGSIVGGLFGKKKIKRYGTYVGGVFNEGEYRQTRTGKIYDRNLGIGSALSSISEQFSKNLSVLLGAFDINSPIYTSAYQYQRGKSKKSQGGFTASVDGARTNVTVKGRKRSPKSIFDELLNKVLGPGLVSAIRSSKIPEGIKSLFGGEISSKEKVVEMINAVTRLKGAQEKLNDTFGITVDQAGRVAKATGLVGDELIAFVTKLTDTSIGVRTVGENIVLARGATTEIFRALSAQADVVLADNFILPRTLSAYDQFLSNIDASTEAGIDMFAGLFLLRDQFSQFTDVIDGLAGGVKSALFGIVNDAEKQKILNDDLEALFAKSDLTVPGSLQELIGLGKSVQIELDTGNASAAALDLAAVFPDLVSAFQATQEAANSLFDDLTNKNSFATLAEYRSFKAVSANYGREFAADYIANTRAGNIEVNGAGQTVQSSDGDVKVVELLEQLRDVTKRFADSQEDTVNALQRIDQLGFAERG